MKCKEVFEALQGWLDEDLAKEVCAEVEVHLEHCPDCRVFVDTLRKTVVLYRSQEDEPVPSDVHSRLWHQLELDDIVAEIPFPTKE